MNNVYCYPYYLKKYFSLHYIMCCVQCTVVGKYSIHSQHFFNIRECEMNNVSWRDCFRALVDMMPSELGPGNNQPSKSDRSHHINPDQSQGHWHQRTNVSDKHVSWIDSKYDFRFVHAVFCFYFLGVMLGRVEGKLAGEIACRALRVVGSCLSD